jgi:DNA-directed RNA polymerase subunit RPC12/RpoP
MNDKVYRCLHCKDELHPTYYENPGRVVFECFMCDSAFIVEHGKLKEITYNQKPM